MKKRSTYAGPCSTAMAAYHGSARTAKAPRAATSAARLARGCRPRSQVQAASGTTTTAGSTSPTGPLTRKAPAAPAPAATSQRSRGRVVPGAGRLDSQPEDRAPGGQRDEEGERQIGQSVAGHGHVAEAGGRDDAGEQRRPFVVPPPRARAGQQGEADPGESGRQARRRGGDAPRRVGRGGQPVVEDRLLEPDLVVVVGSEPIAALEHLAGGLGVVGLVGIGDGGPSQAGEERQSADARNHRRVT